MKVELSTEEYQRLLDLERFLACLRACGVDNWEGYGEAFHMWDTEDEG